jgi:hypothetical protein
MRRPSLILTLIAAAGLTSLGACAKRTLPPGDMGVCYHVVSQKGGTLRYNKVVEKVANLETCAANLEAMRVKFLRMGGSNRDIMGAFQGNFIFIQREGVFTAPDLEAHPYLALVRTGDGRLAIPGAMPQQ